MKIRGMSRLKQMTQRIRTKLAPGALILMYHRIADEASDPWGLCVKPQHFAEHLAILRQSTHPVRLQHLSQHLDQPLHRSVVLTFDDGYADNLKQAKPLLEHYDIPATVFVATGYTGQEREFWWDELERLFLQPGTLPEQLELMIEGKHYQWNLAEQAHYSKESFQRHCHWIAEEQEPPSLRHRIYRTIWSLLQPLREQARRHILDELLTWAEVDPKARFTHRALTLAEVSELEQGHLIEVGAHTVMHPFLSALPVNAQHDEICRNKTHLESLLGHSVQSFAYPYGDYNAETVKVVEAVGFNCACSTHYANVKPQSDRFLLPRVGIQDWDGAEFSRRLARWFDV